MTRTCPYQDCDYTTLSDDDRACPACGRPLYFIGGHDYTELIVDRTRDFTGRDWVFARIDAWLADSAGSRVFFLGGGPGSGKSAVAARLVQLARGDVPAGACPRLVQTGLACYHFCQAQYDAVVEPVGFVKALSLALAGRYPAFAQALTQIGPRHPEIHVQQTVGQATSSEIAGVKVETLEVGGLSARKAFAHLVREPLEMLVQNSDPGPILILIDAMDEALPFDPKDNIVTLLADATDDPRDLPKQVRFLVTGRPDPRVVELIGKPALDLIDNATDSQTDVVDYAERRLTPVLAEPVARQDLAERIAAAGAGNFLYARYVLDDLQKRPADAAALALPPGLDGVYEGFLRREVGRQGRTWRTYRPLLGALVVARGAGLTRQQLAGIMDERPSAVEELLEPCMQYLSGAFPDGPFRIYHQSFRDFLLQSEVYRLEMDEVREDVARYFWAQYTAFRDTGVTLDDTTLANLPTHLAEAGRNEDLHILRFDYGWLQAKLDRLGIYALLADFGLGQGDADDATRRLRQALEQGAYVLAQEKAQLAAQLLGRLLKKDHYEIDTLCYNTRQRAPRPCLIPQSDSLRQSPDLLRVLAGHANAVTGVAITRDGQVVSWSSDGTVKLWEFKTGRELRSFQAHTEVMNAVSLAPDDQLLVSASGDKTLKVWNLASGLQLHTFIGHIGAVNAAAVTSDGRLVVSASDDTTLRVWDLASGQALHTLEGHTEAVNAVAVTSDGRLAISASDDMTLKVWDLASGQAQRTLEGHTGAVNAVAVTPDDRRAISVSYDTIRVWDLAGVHETLDLRGYAGAMSAVAVTPDGRQAVSAPYDNTVRLWDLADGHEALKLTGHPIGGIHAVTLTPDGQLALSGSGSISGGDNTIKVWDIKTGALRHTFRGHTDQVNAIAVMQDRQDSQFIVSASSDRTLRLWDLASMNRPVDVSLHTEDDDFWINGLTATPDGRFVISASRNTLKVWGIDTGAELRTLASRPENTFVRSAVSTRDGQLVVSGSSDGAVQAWDLKTGSEQRTFRGDPASVYSVAATPDSHRAISASQDMTLKVWNLASGDELRTLPGHTEKVYAVAISPDGRYAVSGSADKTLKVWDLMTYAMVRTLVGHDDAVYAVAITPDGHVISAGWDCTLKVWELAGGDHVCTLSGHEKRVFGVAVTPDGRRVISAAEDHRLKVWELASGRCLATFRADDRLRACVALPESALIATGGASGRVHFLRLEE